ncbi:MAG: ABC transporter ATP-binding protein [Candidatus Asgardarchaeia archaeon]
MKKQVTIKVENVTKIYNGGVTALDKVSLEIYGGEIFTLLGPNGAGKTTLIKILTGELKPTEGKVSILGVGYEEFLKSDIRLRVSYVPQENIFWENLTVEENLDFIGSMYKLPKSELKEKIRFLLDEFDLTDVRKRLSSKLSGGMKRKLSVAMSLINDPEILILDEPTAGLDPRTRASLITSLEKLREFGKTILLTTHIVESAERISDRVAIINKGRIVAVDTVDNLKHKHCGEEVIEILYKQLTLEALEAVKSIAHEERIATAGDKVIITQQHGNVIEDLLKIKSKSKDILAVILRKSTLEDTFLFITGETLGGSEDVVV